MSGKFFVVALAFLNLVGFAAEFPDCIASLAQEATDRAKTSSTGSRKLLKHFLDANGAIPLLPGDPDPPVVSLGLREKGDRNRSLQYLATRLDQVEPRDVVVYLEARQRIEHLLYALKDVQYEGQDLSQTFWKNTKIHAMGTGAHALLAGILYAADLPFYALIPALIGLGHLAIADLNFREVGKPSYQISQHASWASYVRMAAAEPTSVYLSLRNSEGEGFTFFYDHSDRPRLVLIVHRPPYPDFPLE